MSNSSSSDLSSPPSSDTEAARPPPPKTLKLKHGKLMFSTKRKAAPKQESSPEPERELSPPHEYALEDSPDVAVSPKDS